jgi:hypothetical protein
VAGLVVPEYVWLTSATGTWTNEKGAEELAKRRAGISHFFVDIALRIENTPFELISQDDFLFRAKRAPQVFMYGVIQAGNDTDIMCANIAALSTDTWGGVEYSVAVNDDTLYAKRHLMAGYEATIKEQAPQPHIRTAAIGKSAGSNHAYMVCVAMILGKEDAHHKSD